MSHSKSNVNLTRNHFQNIKQIKKSLIGTSADGDFQSKIEEDNDDDVSNFIILY